MPLMTRDKTGTSRDKTGTSRDKQGQNRDKQGQNRDRRDKTKTVGTIGCVSRLCLKIFEITMEVHCNLKNQKF